MTSIGESTPGLALDLWRAAHGGPPAIDARRRRRLADLVAFARERSAIYRRLYGAIRAGPVDLASLPPVSRSELMASFEDWVTDPSIGRGGLESFVADDSRVGAPYMGRYFVCTSSGTSGHPGIYVHDARAVRVYQAIVAMRSYLSWLTPRELWAVARLGGREAVVVATGGHFAGAGWMERARRRQTWARHLVRTFSVLSPLPDLVASLQAYRPAMLVGYPSALSLLAEEAAAGRLRIAPALAATAGETLGPTARERIERTFRCALFDSYGASEFPYMAFGCRHGWLHLSADWVVLEPVDRAYRPVPPGEPSHTVLLTNLANSVQPIIRYDLGDSVIVRPDPCPCGNPLPAIRVEGRSAEVLRLEAPSGETIPILPLALSAVLEGTPGVRRFQVIQTGPRTLRVRLAASGDEAAAWAEVLGRLRVYLAAQGLADVELAASAEAPRRDPASGKYREVWSEVN